MLWLGQSVHRMVSGCGSGICMCVWMQILSFLSPPFCECLYACWVCVYLSVISCVCLSYFCVFDMLAFKYASVCACLYAANDCVYLCLSAVYVYTSEHAFIQILLTRSHYTVSSPLVWHVPTVHRQVIDCVHFFNTMWRRVAQEGILEF